jgi:hypothetical protein
VDPVPDPLLLRKSGSVGIEPGTFGLAARNSDHQTTEAVIRMALQANKHTEHKNLVLSTNDFKSETLY